jgi:chromosome segregation ATPase
MSPERQLGSHEDELPARELELSSLRKELARSEDLLDGWRARAREQERELAEAEGKLVEAELRVEQAEDALSSIRGGRAYKLMRVLWRLRRPFGRRS